MSEVLTFYPPEALRKAIKLGRETCVLNSRAFEGGKKVWCAEPINRRSSTGCRAYSGVNIPEWGGFKYTVCPLQSTDEVITHTIYYGSPVTDYIADCIK